jgi:flagellar basal-body rod modification protein FlgD
MSPIPSTSSSSGSNANSSSSIVNSASVATDQNMFLQLLVAQLQNQDPLNPVDGSQFVTQLAQMQQLEASVNMGQDISQIRTDADQFLTDYTGAAASNSTGTSSTNQTS